MAQPKRWIDEVIDVILLLGGQGHYKDIYAMIENRQVMNLKVNKNWDATVRKTIELHSSDSKAFNGKEDIFYSVNGLLKGVWGIRSTYYTQNDIPITSDVIEKEYVCLERTARKLPLEELKSKAKKQTPRPPKQVPLKTITIVRNPYVSEYSKRLANGVCRLCNQSAPFDDQYGNPYLESHHVKWLSKNGLDTIDNTVALCPNCHRKMHIVDDKKDVEVLFHIAINQV